MARKPPFELLQGIAQDAMQEAYEKVAEAIAAKRAAKLQMEKLQQYRHDYLQQLQQTMQRGVRSSAVYNSQRFIDNIDDAIAKQKLQIETLGEHVSKRREVWLAERKKVESMGTLLTRQKQKQARHEVKLEQKQNDEYAARAYRRMQMA